MRAWLLLGMMLLTAVGQSPTIILPKIDPDRVVWLGAAHTPYAGGRVSYTRRQTPKPAGRIRIGIFGPSVATTSEVGQSEDVPTHLQELLKASGHTNVEVLGFGFGSASLQYSYLLWQAIGKRMELDHVVVMLPQIYRDRETHFQGNGGMHGRFVLSGNGLRAVRPIGETPSEAEAIYHSLVPRWNYFRYDTRVPPLLKKFFPDLVTNPFYYRPDPKQEAEEVVRRLLVRWNQEAAHLSVYFPRQGMPDLEARLRHFNIPFFESQLEPLPKVYRSSAVHLSSLGNQARAKELFHYLMGDKSFSVSLLKGELAPLYGNGTPWPEADKRWHIFGGDSHLGTLDPPERLPRTAPVSLVALDPFRYLELATPLKKDLLAELVVATPGTRARFPIGHIHRHNDFMGVFIPLAKNELTLPVGRLRWKEGFHFLAKEKYSKVWLTLGGKPFPLAPQLAVGESQWSPSPITWNFRGRAIPYSLPPRNDTLQLVVRVGKRDIPLPVRVSFEPRQMSLPSPYPWPLARSLASAP